MLICYPLLMTSVDELVAADLALIRSREAEDYRYSDKLLEVYPENVALFPSDLAEKYANIIHASLNAPDSHLVGVYMLAELIPLQLGFKQESRATLHHPRVSNERQEFYLEMALLLAQRSPQWDTDILKNLPGMLERQGAKETRRIVDVALKIRDEDFGDRHNMVLFYTGMKAGARFCGMDEEDHRVLESQVGHMYLGRPLKKKLVFDDETVHGFCERVREMKNPRERRAFIDSFYARIVRFPERQLKNMAAAGIEEFADLCDQFGFAPHADKLLNTRHYKANRSYDDEVAVRPVENGPISALYQTADTRKLDALFDLDGQPIDDVGRLTGPAMWIGRSEQERLMPRFARLAGKAGFFAGVPLQQAPAFFDLDEHYFRDSVREGYLEQFEHEGVVVISPTAKYAIR